MPCFRRLIAIAVSALACVFASAAYATSVIRLDDRELVRLSGTIAEGRVTAVHADWTPDHTQIFTTVTIQVSHQYKGARPDNGALSIRLLGGRVGDVSMELVDQPLFQTGENVIVFLDATSPTYAPLTGLFQGKLTIATDPATGAPTVVDRGVPLDTFVRNISRLVDEQEKGR